ncbi:MAG: glycosyltransferase [Bacteroidia bacterium]|nr:glycosyltransferase [Bacteroidia bacterium]
MWYYLACFAKLAFYKEQAASTSNLAPVSIIIAARNEFENLQKNLIAILEQDYPQFEVVVVNDCSWDNSQAFLEELQSKYTHLKVSQLIEQEKYPTGKKFALTIGIKAASHNLLLFTDADCMPTTNQWLKKMQSKFNNQTEIVLGFSPYRKQKGILNKFIRFETLLTAQFYFSAALMKNAFMGVGRNLAYTKELFFKHKGFAKHQHILSGDDDLFVNQAATSQNVSIQIHPDTFTLTDAKKTFSEWRRQKTRHMSTGKYYQTKHKRLLGTYYLSLFLYYSFTTAALLLNFLMWPYILGLFLIKWLTQTIIFYNSGKKLQSQSLAFGILFYDILYVLYIVIFGTTGLFTKNRKHW